jgi:hypothetical protein
MHKSCQVPEWQALRVRLSLMNTVARRLTLAIFALHGILLARLPDYFVSIDSRH